MKDRLVEFQFKGTRNYIHGTDMFNAMLDGHPSSALENIIFSVHGFVRAPLCRLYSAGSKEALASLSDVQTRCQFSQNGTTQWLALTPEGGSSVSARRYEYDEDRVVSLCSIDKDSVHLLQQSPFTFIESVVAMNKFLHQRIFPDAQGKWIFTRIDLSAGCDARENIGIQLRHNMNYRLTKSDILVNGQKIGDLYFSLVKS